MLEKGLEGRSLDDVLLWLDAVYKQVGPATLEGKDTLHLTSQTLAMHGGCVWLS